MTASFAFARFAAVFALVAATSYGSAVAAPAAKASGEKLCVLTQADFKALGTGVSPKPAANVEQNGENAYCVYRGKSGATGGVELDVFYPAGDTPDDVAQTFKTVLASDPGTQYLPESVPGADESMYSLSVPQAGHPAFAANAVRRGDLVFSISLPSTPNAKAQMLHLSQIVLSRIAK